MASVPLDACDTSTMSGWLLIMVAIPSLRRGWSSTLSTRILGCSLIRSPLSPPAIPEYRRLADSACRTTAARAWSDLGMPHVPVLRVRPPCPSRHCCKHGGALLFVPPVPASRRAPSAHRGLTLLYG